MLKRELMYRKWKAKLYPEKAIEPRKDPMEEMWEEKEREIKREKLRMEEELSRIKKECLKNLVRGVEFSTDDDMLVINLINVLSALFDFSLIF